MNDDAFHAIRWARRELKRAGELDYTRWHWTEDASATICARPIPLALSGGTFVPETDDDMARVDCARCRSALRKRAERCLTP